MAWGGIERHNNRKKNLDYRIRIIIQECRNSRIREITISRTQEYL